MIFKQIDEILSGQKTQTRRAVKLGQKYQPAIEYDSDVVAPEGIYVPLRKSEGSRLLRPYLVVGRTYAVVPQRGEPAVWWRKEPDGIYIAPEWTGGPEFRNVTMRISGYQEMRIRILAIRQERLQDINEPDARAEGVKDVGAYMALWDRINGKTPGARWDDNPAVWVLTFELVR